MTKERSAAEWKMIIAATNKELPPEECGVELTDDEKERYLEDLAWLKEERKKHPDMPISYGYKLSYFD